MARALVLGHIWYLLVTPGNNWSQLVTAVHRVFLGLAFLLLEVLDSDEPNPVPAVRFPFPPPLSGCLKVESSRCAKRNKLGNVSVFVQLICKLTRTKNPLYIIPNIA